MVVSTSVVARRYEDVSAGTPISVDIPAYEVGDVYVYYGNASLVAVQGTDYTVALAGDFETFTVTPTASLLTKINALITGDPTEENYIAVRRALDYLTDATPDGVRYTPYTSREFDRNAMRDLQLAEQVGRALQLPPSVVPTDGVDTSLLSVKPGQYVKFKDDGTGFVGADSQLVVSEVDVWFQNRDVATAAQLTLLADGSVGVMNGRAYLVDSTATGTASATNDLGVDGLIPFGGIDPGHYGAVGDGLADDSAALRAMYSANGSQGHYELSGTYRVDGNVTILGRNIFRNGASIAPTTGNTVTLDGGAVVSAVSDWASTANGGTFTYSAGSFEHRILTKVTNPSGGFAFNFGYPGNAVDEDSGTSFVFGGTSSFPHELGANSELSLIGGGYDNWIGDDATASTVAGGAHHRIADGASHAAILGGSYQTVNIDYGAAISGFQNTVNTQWSTVAGGKDNIAGNDAGGINPLDFHSAFVGGGAGNAARGLRAAIAGGDRNSITSAGENAFVGGGQLNVASGSRAVVSGGGTNSASGTGAVVVGGLDCIASGAQSIAGGSSAQATANYAIALGEFLRATATGAMATGIRSSAYLRGQRSHAAGYFAARGDAQISDLVLRIQTGGGFSTARAMDLNGAASDPLNIPDNTTWAFTATVIARNKDTDGQNAHYKYEGAIKRDSGAATTAFVGTPTKTVIHEDAAGWDIVATADATNGRLVFTATGDATNAVYWVCRLALTEVTG